ncbi:Class I SAM-dependent methyltransferase [Flavobacterium longum]|uniref:class I SAM-dependent methyltransferase n=1 Tax=Flavobacterium longum TaxID=1299340 RepID=UPI0039E9C0A9
MAFKNKIKNFLNSLPHVRGLYAFKMSYQKNACFPPGHYYSPIVKVDDTRKREHEIWKGRAQDGVAGIDLHTQSQLDLLGNLAAFYDEMPFKSTKQANLRFYFDNDFYSYSDGFVLYAMMRHFKPKRIMEIGSGYSSAVMLDTAENFDLDVALTFIEPYPKRLYSLLTDADKNRVTIIEKDIQAIPVATFESLEAGDFLFVDSTHVSKTGSDVNYILFDILPALKPGVLIHFHDVFYPFEYPESWVFEGFNWNEDYLLRAFLMYNDAFKIRLFTEYLHRHHAAAFDKMPLTRDNFGANLWLEKTR